MIVNPFFWSTVYRTIGNKNYHLFYAAKLGELSTVAVSIKVISDFSTSLPSLSVSEKPIPTVAVVFG